MLSGNIYCTRSVVPIRTVLLIKVSILWTASKIIYGKRRNLPFSVLNPNKFSITISRSEHCKIVPKFRFVSKIKQGQPMAHFHGKSKVFFRKMSAQTFVKLEQKPNCFVFGGTNMWLKMRKIKVNQLAFSWSQEQLVNSGNKSNSVP